MRFVLSSALLLVALANAAAVPESAISAKVDYTGSKVVRVEVGEDADRVKEIVDRLSLSSWAGKAQPGRAIDLVVPADKAEAFDDSTAEMKTELMHKDLGASIAAESNFQRYAPGAANNSWFESYHPYNDHVKFLQDLQAAHPENSKMIVAGSSTEGRPINGIHIYSSSGGGVNPAIVFHSTVHAREWITNMVTEYMAYTLLTSYESDAEIKSFIDSYDFYIFPFINPDGFVFSQTNDRLWRKNRQSRSGASCIGTDINRNWNAFWDVPGGASTDPCSQTYKGRAPSDTPEAGSHSDFLLGLAAGQGFKMFVDWHSYSQLFMTPYGYSCEEVAPNDAEHQRLAQAFANGLRAVYGTRFETGPGCPTIYATTGDVSDFAYAKAKAEFSFSAELRDTGRYGFVLPPNQIVPSGIETFAGLRALLLAMG